MGVLHENCTGFSYYDAAHFSVELPVRILSLSIMFAFSASAVAAEGMWTLDNLPRDAMQKAHGFAPDQAWVDRAMRSAARLAGGCSGSFVSPDGLVLTNHHCVIDCVQNLSSKEHDHVNDGFLARTRTEEKQCPGMEINRLEAISDVSERIQTATLGLSGQAYIEAKKSEQSKIEAECVGGHSDSTRCDIVELYQGGVQNLYRYARFQDVRLAFAPEYAAGFFGGDPDNFNFPRYNLDMALLRVYHDGRPIRAVEHLAINPGGAKVGELVMTLGHPGSTQRLLTVAQLETQRDTVMPFRLMFASEFRGVLLQYSTQGEEESRIAQTDLVLVENGLKARSGMFQALLTPGVMQHKEDAEAQLQQWVGSDAARRERYGDPWSAIAKAQQTWRDMYVDYMMVENGLGLMSQQLDWAGTLVRGASERSKPDGKRLREFAEAGLPAVRAGLLAETPLYPAYEKTKLAWSLSKLRERLGVDDPFVRAVLGRQSPEALAARIVDGSKLGDARLRKQLWDGGGDAVAKSDDPAIVLARTTDSFARTLRARYENEVEAVEKRSAEQLAQARFAQQGTSVYPDATFSLRLSHGVIRGWSEQGSAIAPYTDFAGLYARATDFEPFKLAPRWVAAKEKLTLQTPFNQASTNDIVGGNSGSPLINARGELVGLAFDGNIRSLGGSYFYDEAVNRTVSVHPAAMLEALRIVYGADALVEELAPR
jgi:hypothetical protein